MTEPEQNAVRIGGPCGVLSPDSNRGCIKRVGHSSPECRDWRGLTWCGDCMKWTCEHIAENLDGSGATPGS